MTEKLTCKMSDGTEWEVVNLPPDIKLLSGMAVVLRAIKREPRFYWCVYDKVLKINQLFMTKFVAIQHWELDKDNRELPFLLREVIDE